MTLDEEPGQLRPIFTWKESPLTAAQRAWMVPGVPPHARAFAEPQQNVPTSPPLIMVPLLLHRNLTEWGGERGLSWCRWDSGPLHPTLHVN